MSKVTAARMEYVPQLNTLRAFAVGAVAWHHWAPQWGFGLPWGSGVQLFFVLSGFLITGILLSARERSDSGARGTRGHILKSFYARRFLRIFPLYYAVLALALWWGVDNVREDWPWYFFYASNYMHICNQAWSGGLSHFWTLAVEEQFYLIWPWLVLFLPRRWLPWSFGCAIGVALVYRMVGVYFWPEIKFWWLATPGSFDSLAIGALLAYFYLCKNKIGCWLERWRGWLLVSSVALYILVRAGWCAILVPGVWSLTLLSFVYAMIMLCVLRQPGGLIGKVLDNSFLQYTGKISYGLYVLHLLAGIPVALTLKWLPFLPESAIINLALLTFWTYFGAMLSWHLFELPINKLKLFVPYLPHRASSGGT